MRSRSTLWLAAFAGALAVATPSRAAAFCRTSTGKLQPGCHPHGTDCCTVGKPIYWPNRCIGWSMQNAGTHKLETVSFALARATVVEAFAVWTSTSCPGADGASRVSIDARMLADAECNVVGTKDGVANQNIIVFRDEVWNHDDPDNVLALTSVSFDPDSGEIHGADLEINSANFILECAAPGDGGTCFDGPARNKNQLGADVHDIASVITHEVGHFLGMAHSNDPNATMTPQYPTNPIGLRTLTEDDIAGICSAYPPDGTRRTGPGPNDFVKAGPCDPTPAGGFASECQDKKCSTGPHAPTPAGGGAAVATAVLATLALRRRARTKPRSVG